MLEDQVKEENDCFISHSVWIYRDKIQKLRKRFVNKYKKLRIKE